MISFMPETESFIKKHELTFINEGRHRAAFRTKSGKYVVKIPIAEGGDLANWNEFWDYERKSQWFGDDRLARCRLICVAGTECLLMELVTMPPEGEELPPWVSYVDCQQVGYTRRGKLVAYDWR